VKHTAKYYPGSPAVQILGKVHDATYGGYITQESPTRVGLTLDHGDHHQRWRNYHRDTLAALVEDDLVTVDPTSGDHGQPISLTTAGRELWTTVMSR
jgi:hypothetical protein